VAACLGFQHEGEGAVAVDVHALQRIHLDRYFKHTHRLELLLRNARLF
jgi:hypothetical protein